MSSDLSLSPPEVLVDYKGLISLKFKYDDECINQKQGNCEFAVPECPVAPRIFLQTVDNGGKPQGPIWTHEAGQWVTYDERLHEIPLSDSNGPILEAPEAGVEDESSALVDAGTELPQPLELSASAEVEVDGEAAPTLSDPPSDDDVDNQELDEPSLDVEEDDEE